MKEKTLCVMAQELSDSNTGLTLWRREGRTEGRLVVKSYTAMQF